MKATLIAIISLFVVFILAISFLNRLGVKNVHNFSDSKYTSMTNGFWMMDYAPTKNVIKLKFWPLKIALDSAWVECQWIEEANFLGSSLEKKNNGRFNIGFKIKSEATTDFVYSLDIIPDRLGSISAFNPLTKQHEGVLFQFPDTLKIIVQEKNSVDSISWIKHIATDTLIYVKCKNK